MLWNIIKTISALIVVLFATIGVLIYNPDKFCTFTETIKDIWKEYFSYIKDTWT